MTRIAVIYYSATGNVHALARAVADGAAEEGADVRLRHVAELQPEMLISVQAALGPPSLRTRGSARRFARGSRVGTRDRLRDAHSVRECRSAAEGVPRPRRRALGAEEYSSTRSRPLSPRHRPSTAARSRRSSRSTTPSTTGARSCSRSATRCTRSFNGGGNPYGASYTSDHRVDGQPDETTLMVARAQGARLARVAA